MKKMLVFDSKLTTQIFKKISFVCGSLSSVWCLLACTLRLGTAFSENVMCPNWSLLGRSELEDRSQKTQRSEGRSKPHYFTPYPKTSCYKNTCKLTNWQLTKNTSTLWYFGQSRLQKCHEDIRKWRQLLRKDILYNRLAVTSCLSPLTPK